MGTIYTTQPFEIKLGYDILPGAIASVKIKYINPAKVAGEFIATLNEIDKLVEYISAPTEKLSDHSNKPNGTWVFWSYFICNDGGEFPGEPVAYTIYAEGKKA